MECWINVQYSPNHEGKSNIVFNNREDYAKKQNRLYFKGENYGDVNHDGVLTEDDSTWILRKLVNSSDLEFTFSDGLTHYTKATSELVADFDQDGEIAISDVVALNNYLS